MVDELQRLMDSESQARDMISSWIADILSDLAIIAECLRQIDLYQPWANSFEDLLVDRKENIQAEFAKSTAPWGKIMTIFSSKGPNASILAKLGAPVDGKFYYPSDKRRSEENTKAMQRAEENLDLFWSKVSSPAPPIRATINGVWTCFMLIVSSVEGW